MTLNQIIYDLRSIIRNNRLADDDRLNNRLLKEWVHTHRAAWIRRESSKGGWQVDRQIIQSIYDTLEVADRTKVRTLVTGGSILRTSQDIPEAIELKNRTGILEVGPVDKIALPFSFVSIQRARTFGSGKFNSTAICAFPYDKKIYLWAQMTNESFYKYIRYLGIDILAEDPTDAARFNHINGDPCYSDDDNYPMNSWMWKFLKDEILETNLDALMKIPVDKTNDADDATNER